MKRLLATILSLFILATNAFAIDLYVDGKKLEPDVAPTIINNRTLVPVRTIFESIGATVNWDNSTRTVTAQKGDKKILLTIGDTIAYVNGQKKTLDVPAQTINSRTMVPVRFVSEALNAEVWWEAETSTVYVATTTNFDGYRIAPKIIYSTPADENGFGETFMYMDGTVTGFQTLNGYNICNVKTEDGILSILSVPSVGDKSEWNRLTIGNEYRICFLYVGFSEILKTPCGAFMEIGRADAITHYPGSNTENKAETPKVDENANPNQPIESNQPAPEISNTVYVTKTGKRYHYDPNCNGGTYYKSTLLDAQSRGLTPCSKCVK